jgi:hypothetical protein
MRTKPFYIVITAVIAASVLFWGFMFQDRSVTENGKASIFEGEITITMYHGEGCMCCVRWAEYLEENGVTVIEELVPDLHKIKREKGVPGQLSSCHTAIVDGYVVEGHVPVEDIRRLLSERPDATGISVPGMPPNAPGMDQPVKREYQTVLFDSENMSIYAVHE